MGDAEGTRMAEGPCGTEVVSPVEIAVIETGKPEGRGVRMDRRPLRGRRSPEGAAGPDKSIFQRSPSGMVIV